MKTFLLCISALALSGCATVSMVSQEAVVETEATEVQSDVHNSARAFEDLAESEGWVSGGGGLAGLADMLFGSDDDGARKEKASTTYAERVSAGSAEPASVYDAIASDADKAAKSLTELEQLANELLKAGDVRRTDLISFEGALVTAQKSYRSFSEATGLTEERGNDGIERAEDALKDFAGVIDAARRSADDMADAYSVSSGNKATS